MARTAATRTSVRTGQTVVLNLTLGVHQETAAVVTGRETAQIVEETLKAHITENQPRKSI
jgi:hypothetical protein